MWSLPHMCGKNICVKFFWDFLISSRTGRMGRCVVAIIAFVWLLLCCAFSNVSSKPIQSCICLTFPHDMFDFSPLCVFKWLAWDEAKSHWFWLFSTLCFYLCTQIACLWECKVTWLHLFDFSPLYVFKCLLKWPATEDAYCIVTLVAFVWFFCTVYFQMLTGKVTLDACVWLFSRVRFQMSPQMACPRTCLIKNTDFQNFHVCGKNQTCVGISKLSCVWFLPHMCGFYQIPKTCQGVW